MQNGNKKITVLSVSFKSAKHLSRLFKNLAGKAGDKKSIQFLVVDKTDGNDKQLSTIKSDEYDVSIIGCQNNHKQRSKSHAEALDKGLELVDTKYTLILDPDVHVFKQEWDNYLINKIEDNTIIGAPYPHWKIGKVHDYPSVVFMFFRTQEIKKLKKSFSPFPVLLKILSNSLLRKFNRLLFLANKHRLNSYKILRSITKYLENLFGVTSPDTGNKIICAIRDSNFKSINFNACYSNDLNKNVFSSHHDLAKYFELYLNKNEIFLTHMYGSGVFHWKTKKGNNVEYWLSLIKKIEKEKKWII